jgi:hypothetical protein
MQAVSRHSPHSDFFSSLHQKRPLPCVLSTLLSAFFDLFIMIPDCNGFRPLWKDNKVQQIFNAGKETFETQGV